MAVALYLFILAIYCKITKEIRYTEMDVLLNRIQRGKLHGRTCCFTDHCHIPPEKLEGIKFWLW